MDGGEGTPLETVHAVAARFEYIFVDVCGRQQRGDPGVGRRAAGRDEGVAARELRRLFWQSTHLIRCMSTQGLIRLGLHASSSLHRQRL